MPYVAPFIGRIKYNDQIVGTGFVVHESGLIATCYHVLKVAGEPFTGKIFTFEPLIDLAQAVQATALAQCDQAHDVALLRLNEPLPEGVEVARLVRSDAAESGMHFETQGYGRLDDAGHRYSYGSAAGTVVGPYGRDNTDVLVLESKHLL